MYLFCFPVCSMSGRSLARSLAFIQCAFTRPLLRTRRQCEGRSVIASEAKALPLGAYVSLGTDELAGVGSVDVWNAFEKAK